MWHLVVGSRIFSCGRRRRAKEGIDVLEYQANFSTNNCFE
jgi:hypothetical protein